MNIRQIVLVALIIGCFLLLAPYAGIRIFSGTASPVVVDEAPKASLRIQQSKPELHEIESLLDQQQAPAKR